MTETTCAPKTAVIRICDVVVVKDGDAINYEYDGRLRKWRVESFMKDAVRPGVNPDSIREIVLDVTFDASNDSGPNKTRLQWCSQSEAQYVSLYSVCGSIARIEDCEIVGRVTWSQEYIQQAEESARSFEGRVLF